MSQVSEAGSKLRRTSRIDPDAVGDGPETFCLGPDGPCDPEVARRLTEGLAALPPVGIDFLGFHLESELGRGAFSRVYLARQTDLAHRAVALKVSVDLFGEPQLLAQLQHTNIVPIYSAHRAGPLQAVCMPYFGPTTLADVLEGLHGRAVPPETGAALVSMLHGTLLQGVPAVPQAAAREPRATVKMLQGMSYVRALLWVAVRVADGLAHAHERGILHRDLKPANILLSDEGQPMLLDFNLSEDVKQRARGPASLLGGTLPYMAPEHLEAFRGGARALDVRGDVWSLGVILYEMLTGRLPFESPRGPLADALPLMLEDRRRSPRTPRALNRAVTPAVEAIVRRCLDPEPDRRYQTAAELREDLQRQLEDRPLRHAPELSLRERLGKWARRHPRLASPVTVGALVAILAALWAVPAAWVAWQDYRAAADHAADEKREATAEKRRATELAHETRESAERLAACRLFRADALALRGLEDKLVLLSLVPDGLLSADDDPGQDVTRCVELLGRYRVLEDPAWQEAPAVRGLPAADREQLLATAGELLYLLGRAALVRLERSAERGRANDPARAGVPLPGPTAAVWGGFDAAVSARVRAALEHTRLAEACYPAGKAPRALLAQRAALTRLLGREVEAAALSSQAAAVALGSARDHTSAAWELVKRGRFKDALPLLHEATRRAPGSFGAWLLKAVCHDHLSEHEAAEAAYSTCIALKPQFVWGYLSRGTVSLNRREWEAAERDFTEVLAIKPQLGFVYVQRAAARKGLNKNHEAVQDLNQALERGAECTDVYYFRAMLREKLNDAPGMKRDRDRVLQGEPTTANGWLYRGLTQPAGRAGAEAALADFGKALELDPRCAQALFHKARLLSRDLGRPAEAAPVLDRLLALYPNHPDARLNRAVLLARLGKRPEARRDAEQCLFDNRSAWMHYQVAAVYALNFRGQAPERKRILELLSFAVRNGYGHERIADDPDLRLLRSDPEFHRLVLAVYDLGRGTPARKRPE